MQNHPIFAMHKDALIILGYYDDLEIANPLGSKSKIHKIGVFYYLLGNMHPMYRSTIRNIQLIGIAKTQDLKRHGIDRMLLPFTKELNELAKEQGHCFMIHGQERHLWGGLVLWTGDTLGSNCVSGFKEGVGGALRICRHCMGTKEETKQKFRAEEFQARNLNNHLRICTMIEDPDNAPHVSDALSTTYGVNGLSVMNQVANFDICQCFPEDIMHILFEGVVPYATKQCLKVLIDEKRCPTLRELNNRLESFNYGYMNNKNKPTPTECIG